MPIGCLEAGLPVCRTIGHYLQLHAPEQGLLPSRPQIAVADTVVPLQRYIGQDYEMTSHPAQHQKVPHRCLHQPFGGGTGGVSLGS